MGFNTETRNKLTDILREPGNGILLYHNLRQKYSQRHGKSPCSKKFLRDALLHANFNKDWPGVTIGYGGQSNAPSAVYAVWTYSITCLLTNGQQSNSFTLEEVRMLYGRKYNQSLPLNDKSLTDILRSENVSIRPRATAPLGATSILRDSYVP
eukprot:scaffold5184_cov155-Skeletonema_marinoi.AAC.4